MSSQRLIDIHHVAEMLGIKINTVYTWVNQRKIPYIKVGRLVKFDLVDIETWISAHRVETHKHWDKP